MAVASPDKQTKAITEKTTQRARIILILPVAALISHPGKQLHPKHDDRTTISDWLSCLFATINSHPRSKRKANKCKRRHCEDH